MIEQFLQTALEFIKEIWFQLDSRFDLENTETFKFLKPYLIQLQDNPVYMGISLTALFLVPYALIKVRSISKERERKLDELMEEMEEEEEYDADDPRRLRRSEPEDDEKEKPLFGNEKETSSPYTKSLDDIEEEDFEAQLEEFELESSEPALDEEESREPVSSQLTESEFDKELNEFMSLGEDTEFHLDDTAHDQAIKELQEEGELMELDDQPLDPFAHYSDLDEDAQDKAIRDLQEEMERTINKLTEQIEEPNEAPNSIKDLSEIHIGGSGTIDDDYSHDEEFFLEDLPPEPESTDTQSEAPEQKKEPNISLEELEEESAPVSELSDSEILSSLESEADFTLEEETEPEPETAVEIEPAIPRTRDYEPELSGFTFEAESEIPPEETEVPSENFTFEAEPSSFEDIDQAQPRSADEYASPEKTDSLIEQLKFLQSRFENRYQHTEQAPAPIEKNIPEREFASITEPRRYSKTPAGLSPDSKKYMDLLESFVFMKDQKKHK
jgi:hypothetical protein